MQSWNPDELKAAIEEEKSVFLKLWKKGCGPCKLSSPACERLEAADTSGMIFAQISTDDYPEMLEIAEVESLPAFFLFADKKMQGKTFGFKGIKKLEEFIAQNSQ